MRVWWLLLMLVPPVLSVMPQGLPEEKFKLLNICQFEIDMAPRIYESQSKYIEALEAYAFSNITMTADIVRNYNESKIFFALGEDNEQPEPSIEVTEQASGRQLQYRLERRSSTLVLTVNISDLAPDERVTVRILNHVSNIIAFRSAFEWQNKTGYSVLTNSFAFLQPAIPLCNRLSVSLSLLRMPELQVYSNTQVSRTIPRLPREKLDFLFSSPQAAEVAVSLNYQAAADVFIINCSIDCLSETFNWIAISAATGRDQCIDDNSNRTICALASSEPNSTQAEAEDKAVSDVLVTVTKTLEKLEQQMGTTILRSLPTIIIEPSGFISELQMESLYLIGVYDLLRGANIAHKMMYMALNYEYDGSNSAGFYAISMAMAYYYEQFWQIQMQNASAEIKDLHYIITRSDCIRFTAKLRKNHNEFFRQHLLAMLQVKAMVGEDLMEIMMRSVITEEITLLSDFATLLQRLNQSLDVSKMMAFIENYAIFPLLGDGREFVIKSNLAGAELNLQFPLKNPAESFRSWIQSRKGVKVSEMINQSPSNLRRGPVSGDRSYEGLWLPVTLVTDRNATNWYSNSSSSQSAQAMMIMSSNNQSFSVSTPTQWYVLDITTSSAIYQVNYDLENWHALIDLLSSDASALSARQRAVLLDDCFGLAFRGHLNYSVPLRLSKYLRSERSLAPLYHGLLLLVRTAAYANDDNGTNPLTDRIMQLLDQQQLCSKWRSDEMHKQALTLLPKWPVMQLKTCCRSSAECRFGYRSPSDLKQRIIDAALDVTD